MIHDSVILDMAQEDEGLLNDIYHEFANTDFGIFDAVMRAGKNFGEMKKLWIIS